MISFTKRFVCATFALGISLAASANSDLTAEEQDSITKEDIASLEVLSELCNQVVGKNPQLQQNIQRLINQNQHTLSQPKLVQGLAQDQEYQSLVAENKSNSKEMSQTELKAACEDVLNSP
ncbi:MCR_0457 family protein [Acinetobacter sp. MB5]|uniref:MCR_0457 family protein n=1 Tax=Acinetobacter sp. MB5 TaxID=2069438 RepID=UPI000DD011BC|nr:hypothetical protein [Acinetobacter sp. MB5]